MKTLLVVALTLGGIFLFVFLWGLLIFIGGRYDDNHNRNDLE